MNGNKIPYVIITVLLVFLTAAITYSITINGSIATTASSNKTEIAVLKSQYVTIKESLDRIEKKLGP